MKRFDLKGFTIGVLLVVVVTASAVGGALVDRVGEISFLDNFVPRREGALKLEQRVVNEESVVIDVSARVSPSVVTVSVETPRRRILEFNPFEGFRSRVEGGSPQDIGSGFVVSEDGLIVTNKHVVSLNDVKYKVITNDDKEYEVLEINRDPTNDLAILKVDAKNLPSVELGDSGNLKVGQFVIAIGTALGEFRHTVTTGVISGLGRGIVAGSALEGYVERLDDVIQTDAAINPGNSGGPLLNSAGQVIGVNVAVASGAQNVGFAIPINIIKESLREFEKNGRFVGRPFLGVRYQMIGKRTALMNDVPQGAYVVEVVEGSAAEDAGIEVDDILTEFDGKSVSESEDGLSEILKDYEPGDKVKVKVWRGEKEVELQVTLSEFSE